MKPLPDYKTWPKGKVRKTVETSFYGMQGAFAKNEEHERLNVYAKPGTSAAKRAGDPHMTSYPLSRYRSMRP